MRKQKLTAKALRSLPREERLKLLEQLRSELLKLRTQKERGALENPGKIRAVRRAIARILTIENEETLREKVLKLLEEKRGRAFTLEEIAKMLNERRINFLRHVIWRLQLEGKITKVGLRKFMLKTQ